MRKGWIAEVAEKVQKKIGLDDMDLVNQDRATQTKNATRFFIDIHKPYSDKGWTPTRSDLDAMRALYVFRGGMRLTWGMFLNTLKFQASEEQQSWWMEKTLKMKIIGCYAQTELGHGSNVRGIQTTATFEKETQSFILNTPTLQATKWWITGLGCTATHALVYAQLVIDGKEYGVHTFMVQVRDENHLALPGIEVGDVGNKLGEKASDTGYLRMENVRIPREHMLNRFQEVTPDGEYRKVSAKKGGKATGDARMGYLTMIATRVEIVATAGEMLARAAVAATRYSLVRHQGFVDPRPGAPAGSPENQVIDYGHQRYRLFKNMSIAYAMKLTGLWMRDFMKSVTTGGTKEAFDLDILPELHASSAGIKGVACLIVADGMEDCRKACGGHGYLLSAGIGQHYMDYLAVPTLEGESMVMALQTARFLVKSCNNARSSSKPLSALCSYLQPLRGSTTFTDELSRRSAPKVAANIGQWKDTQYLLSVVQHRAMVAVATVTDLLNSLQKTDAMSYQQAWNAAGRELVLATRQHVIYFLLKNFKSVVDEIEDTPVRNVLTNLLLLFGLSDLQDGSWIGLVESGLMGSQPQILLKAAVQQILADLRPNAAAISDAWQIPDRVLHSALGRYDGKVYEALLESARKSELNRQVPFDGYKEFLQPCLDLEFLRYGNKPASKYGGTTSKL
eukprot:TRINITY_DN16467_c0_g1_i2.p1 TRINITY_DN16467_c0_g1~~TRINITY_DN16467_c0_g1_i2.p1  ORF type:complete len:720 (+),score=32.30 TRINITY_DN16467_c0_g1_i2:127-2160(+)